MKRGWQLLVLVVVGVVLSSACASRTESILRERRYVRHHPPEKVAHYWEGVEYARPGGKALTMDISAPEGDGPFPCLMVIHGGGWFMHTNTVMEGMSRYITNRGYVVFNINYRVVPDVVMLDIANDCLGALVWIKEHAGEYHGDPSRLAVTGDSAGGHLTALLVTSANDPAFHPTYPGKPGADRSITCAIPTYGVYELSDKPRLIRVVVGKKKEQDPALFALLSPIRHVRKDLPPQLVLVGDKDGLYQENMNYVEALRKVGAPVELEVFPGLGHAFLNYYWESKGINGMDRMVRFMDEQMKR